MAVFSDRFRGWVHNFIEKKDIYDERKSIKKFVDDIISRRF